MKKALTLLKRITHRELSPSELEKTRKGVETSRRFLVWGRDKNYTTIDGEPHLIIRRLRENTTPDISHEGVFHTCFYIRRETGYRYTADGKLVERHTSYGNDYEGGNVHQETVLFEPPGCWYGEQVEGIIREVNGEKRVIPDILRA